MFVADGYRNRRVIVFEGATGKYLRHWGAYGKPPDDTQKNANDPEKPNEQFSTVHGLTGSKDGMIYVADRRGNRIQVFDQSGKFVKREDHRAAHAGLGLVVRDRALTRSPRSSGCISPTGPITKSG